MSAPKKVVYLIDGYEPEEGDMKFRLTYRGPLRSTQNEPRGGQAEPLPRAKHKHDIRRHFHRQLKELWRTNRFLREEKVEGKNSSMQLLVDVVADRYKFNAYRFVPLVRPEISLFCSLDILFLRRDIPGSVIDAGDIDNRLKTLIDALRMPKIDNQELASNEIPGEGEDPFFVLLEDDKQVTQFSVESDTLLNVPEDSKDSAYVELFVTVNVRPYHVDLDNVSYA